MVAPNPINSSDGTSERYVPECSSVATPPAATSEPPRRIAVPLDMPRPISRPVSSAATMPMSRNGRMPSDTRTGSSPSAYCHRFENCRMVELWAKL